jgi:crossover junction endodeoxyribonuclease RusA
MSAEPVMSLTFALPWPPSVNTYWRHIILGGKHKKARAQTILSEQGRDYRVAVLRAIREAKVPVGAVKGRLSVHATAYPLDALRHAGVIVDDENIDDLHIVRGPKRPGGCLLLKVSELGEYREQAALELLEPASEKDPF